MTRTAFLFPGQGSQSVGMGKLLHDAVPQARAVFQEADDVLGFPLSRLCFQGPAEDLQRTENTQPAMLTASIAALRALEARGVAADYVAGHSLGEYAALVAAGSLEFADALRLVRKRGRYMQEAVPQGIGAMAALVRLPGGALDALLAECAQGESLCAANFNSPGQVVIAGHTGAVQRAVERARSLGATGVPLPVSAPFHCPLMMPAQRRLLGDLDAVAFRDPVLPLINNWRAAEVRSGDEARHGLARQVSSPVQWERSMRELVARKVTRVIEVGPGAVLAGLMRAIAPQIERRGFAEPAHAI